MANVMEAGTVWKKSSAAKTKLWQSISWAQLDRKVQIWEASSNDSKDSRKKWTSSDTNSWMVWYGDRTGVHMWCFLEHPPVVKLSFWTSPNLQLLSPIILILCLGWKLHSSKGSVRLTHFDIAHICTSNPLQHVSTGRLATCSFYRPHPPMLGFGF